MKLHFKLNPGVFISKSLLPHNQNNQYLRSFKIPFYKREANFYYSKFVKLRLSTTLPIILLLLTILSFIQTANANQIDKVRVGIFHNKPMCYFDDTGKPAGIFVSVVEYVAAKEGWDFSLFLFPSQQPST